MSELMRDTIFGHFLRIVSHDKLFPYAEDKDPQLWKRYVNHAKTDRMADHGNTGENVADEKIDSERPPSSSQETSRTRTGSDQYPTNGVTGHRIDQEKGRDVSIVDWYGDDDPEVGSHQ